MLSGHVKLNNYVDKGNAVTETGRHVFELYRNPTFNVKSLQRRYLN